MWPHSGVDLGPIKMANIPDDGLVSKIVDCCQIDDVNQSCEYRIIYLSFFLKRCLIIESILILSRIQQVGNLFSLSQYCLDEKWLFLNKLKPFTRSSGNL